MRPIVGFLLAIVLLFVAPANAAVWSRAVGHLDDKCTVVAIRPNLLVTASHCVIRPGWEHKAYYYRGIQNVPVTALAVWDGYFTDPPVDLAFLSIESRWPTTLPLARHLPPADTLATVYGYLLSTRQQTARVYTGALTEHTDYGWILPIFGPVGPGMSGGPVIVRGEIVGIAVAVYLPLLRAIAIPAGTVASAIRDLDRNGPMNLRPGWSD